ncbi:hypothetical protein GUITHDRAFT_108731 [Guillardia theta CCMP2712]|uniref:Uncharacterized protein n=1 Tax=Guillardia theta (strain CCMP2712) TaxID=905079 RepID=L1JAX6_GUITC|nr:hypothetical protein GUITHDRAFT_108731 [Guillardia theta CCMP2712]EKX45467.1 hypothetical protein GUITHDRAFT_108731 [Guillardia theta CCMP2712]|eukprot:XP_005832447.1 hypothetical protein GUITHDRAFT_108731 [Guillardia theta CCMP2712]
MRMSEEEKTSHPELLSSEVSEGLLLKLEDLEARLTRDMESMRSLLAGVAEYENLLRERAMLETTFTDSSRLLDRTSNSYTLRRSEERYKALVLKIIPERRKELLEAIEEWERSNGKAFLTWGRRYLDSPDEVIPADEEGVRGRGAEQSQVKERIVRIQHNRDRGQEHISQVSQSISFVSAAEPSIEPDASPGQPLVSSLHSSSSACSSAVEEARACFKPADGPGGSPGDLGKRAVLKQQGEISAMQDQERLMRQELGESDSKSRDAAIHKLTVRMRRMEGGVSGRPPAPDISADMMKRCQVGQDSPKAEEKSKSMPADALVLKKDHSKLQESLKLAQEKIVTLEAKQGKLIEQLAELSLKLQDKKFVQPSDLKSAFQSLFQGFTNVLDPSQPKRAGNSGEEKKVRFAYIGEHFAHSLLSGFSAIEKVEKKHLELLVELEEQRERHQQERIEISRKLADVLSRCDNCDTVAEEVKLDLQEVAARAEEGREAARSVCCLSDEVISCQQGLDELRSRTVMLEERSGQSEGSKSAQRQGDVKQEGGTRECGEEDGEEGRSALEDLSSRVSLLEASLAASAPSPSPSISAEAINALSEELTERMEESAARRDSSLMKTLEEAMLSCVSRDDVRESLLLYASKKDLKASESRTWERIAKVEEEGAQTSAMIKLARKELEGMKSSFLLSSQELAAKLSSHEEDCAEAVDALSGSIAQVSSELFKFAASQSELFVRRDELASIRTLTSKAESEDNRSSELEEEREGEETQQHSREEEAKKDQEGKGEGKREQTDVKKREEKCREGLKGSDEDQRGEEELEHEEHEQQQTRKQHHEQNEDTMHDREDGDTRSQKLEAAKERGEEEHRAREVTREGREEGSRESAMEASQASLGMKKKSLKLRHEERLRMRTMNKLLGR